MPLSRLLLALLALLLPAAGRAAAAPPPPPAACNFSSYILHDLVTSWEVQLDVPAARCLGRPRVALLGEVAAALGKLASDPAHSMRVAQHSLRTSVIEQTSAAVSTLDGRPLFPGRRRGPELYPWRGPAFVRCARDRAARRRRALVELRRVWMCAE
jgi:hypothetical protein